MDLTKAILHAVKWPIITNMVLELMNLFVRIFLVWIAKKLLDSLSDASAPVSDGYMWAGILSGLLLIALYLEHHYYYQATLLPLHIRSSLISMVYTKVTKLSVYSLNQISLGKLVNIVANDVNVFERTGLTFSNLVVGIFGLIGSTALLWIFFGEACLVGIGYCIIGFPLQQFLAKMSGKPRDQKNGVTDERVKLTSEVIDGIRLLKMYTWELAFRDIINKIRAREINLLKKVTNLESLSRGIALSTQAVASFLIWMTYVLAGNELTVSIVFPSIFLVGLIRIYSVFYFSLALGFVAETKLLIQRIENVLEAPEIGEQKFREPKNKDHAVEFVKFCAYWTKEGKEDPRTLVTQLNTGMASKIELERSLSKMKLMGGSDTSQMDLDKTNTIMGSKTTPRERPTLCDITMSLKKGSLNAVIGKVGSGKSSLLLSLTGEMPRTEGILRFRGTVAYVEQEPTIFAGTLRENILFGKTYDADFYNEVVKSCNLESDIKLFPNGDLSEIGEKGVNLSGGQKARLALARAVYADADIYLLDDPLSAVDAKVAKSLYNDAIVNQLKGKTVILATHQVHFVKDLENIIVVEDGKVIGNGNYNELKAQDVDVDKIFSTDQKKKKKKTQQLKNIAMLQPGAVSTPAKEKQIRLNSHEDEEEEEKEEEKKKLKTDEEKGKLFSNEDAYAGTVNLKTYKTYIKGMGGPIFFMILFFMYVSNEVANVAFSRIVGIWASGEFGEDGALGTMAGITVFIVFIYIAKTIVLCQLLLKSARWFHDQMLDRILRNPTQFFDTNPVGRILNRFSNDLGVLDRFLPLTITDVAENFFLIVSSTITIAVINPLILAPIGGAVILIILLLKACYQAIRQTRNYELGSKSPLYSLFSSSLSGIIVIRSYKQTDNFIQKFRTLLHNNTKGSIAFCSASRLFGFGADLTYTLAAIANIFIVTSNKSISPGLSGLSISFILTICGMLQFALRQTVQMNVLMASVGRVQAYCETTPEAALTLPKDEEVTKAGWPQAAKIELNKVYMKYRANTDYVIKDLNLSAEPGEKIGCVGRTGAGKSSIIQILFRMVELDREAENTDQSFVTIDGVDIQSLGLHTVRNSISIIPQTPFVFTGSIKRNLDPVGQFTDEQLWKVLEDVNLRDHVEQLDKKLYTDMTNASSVFSVGQKQLICLARAILKKSKLLVLDEATANVDLETDNFIQKKIMEKFSHSTIFTIAHRLSTIANYDKVLVLDKGKKVEFDEPYKLLVKEIGDDSITNEKGHFASMVLNTGPKAAMQILQMAKTKYFEKHS